MIRPATLADVMMLCQIAEKEARTYYPRMKSDKSKIKKVLTELVSSARHFCWVSCGESGVPSGVLAAITNENVWAQRQSSNVLLWTASVPGDGIRLLEEFRTWITSRRAVKVAGFAVDNDIVDSRVWQLASMLGFKRYGGSYLLYN